MIKEYIVEIDDIRVDEYAYQKEISKKALKAIKMRGDILVNGIHQNVRYILKKNDHISFIYPNEENQIEPWYTHLNIVYEDDYLLVIDKEKGMPILPTRSHPYHTLVNALMGYYKQNHIQSTIHLVNRLDKDTSGYLLVAKYRDIHHYFSKDINKVKRVYHAYVEGIVDEGTIDLPILKVEKQMRRIIDEKGKPSITHYRLIKSYDDYSLVECVLQTGRTHQIRVHMAAIGHPLIGDSLYGGKEGEFYLDSVEISFTHPISKEVITLKK
jgi:23S rRNA pseudouridine1911/1915/1917 synthase